MAAGLFLFWDDLRDSRRKGQAGRELLCRNCLNGILLRFGKGESSGEAGGDQQAVIFRNENHVEIPVFPPERSSVLLAHDEQRGGESVTAYAFFTDNGHGEKPVFRRITGFLPLV